MAAGVTTLLGMGELRTAAAQALAPATDTDPYVFEDLVDNCEPPALVLDQGDPWLTPGQQQVQTFGPCLYTARLRVYCLAGRTEPGPGIDAIEVLQAYVLERLRADPYTWSLETVGGRGQIDMSGITYFGSVITYLVPTTT